MKVYKPKKIRILEYKKLSPIEKTEVLGKTTNIVFIVLLIIGIVILLKNML